MSKKTNYEFMPGYYEWHLIKDGEIIKTFDNFEQELPEKCTRENLKGLWIPIEVLTDKNLSDKEKHIYSLIIFLSQEKGYCFCTNKTISELLNISVTQVSKLVNSLKDKEYINIEMIYKENSKEVDVRKLIPIEEKLNTLFNKSLIPSPTKLQYPIEEKFKDNKYNINKYKNNNKKGYCNYEQKSLMLKKQMLK